MKRLIYPICLIMLLSIAACRKHGDALTHASARRAAERYFTMIIDKHYEQFVDGLVGTDSIPDTLRSQMIDLLAQAYEKQANEINKKMLKVSATADSIQDSTAYVFLDVLYGDSTTEQVGMLLLFDGERWLMQ